MQQCVRRTAMRSRFSPPAIAAAFVALLIAAAPVSVPAQPSIAVFATASMTTAVDEINAAFTKKTGIKVTPSYAASSALARQIEQGAPADVFISADIHWMDYIAKKDQLRANTRFNLAGNRLVLIAPEDSKIDSVEIEEGFDLAGLVGKGRIATGDVEAVPVGRYAKAALETLGSWNAAEKRFAMADNVRAALILVARGEAALGIVYQTDAKVEPGVKVVGVFPEGSHPPIIYPVATTAKASPAADKYLAFLRTPEVAKMLENRGFTVLVKK